jgi:hypothetical protein
MRGLDGGRMERRRSPSRRRLLARAGSVAVAMTLLGALARCTSLGPAPPRSRDPGDDSPLLDNLLGLESEAVAAYEFVRAAGALDGTERAAAAAFEDDHRKHEAMVARLIERLAGRPAAAEGRDYRFSSGAVARRDDAIDFLIGIEQGLALAQLAAVPAFAGRALAKDAAAMLGVEAMHWAFWRRARGEAPVPAPFLTQ